MQLSRSRFTLSMTLKIIFSPSYDRSVFKCRKLACCISYTKKRPKLLFPLHHQHPQQVSFKRRKLRCIATRCLCLERSLVSFPFLKWALLSDNRFVHLDSCTVGLTMNSLSPSSSWSSMWVSSSTLVPEPATLQSTTLSSLVSSAKRGFVCIMEKKRLS